MKKFLRNLFIIELVILIFTIVVGPAWKFLDFLLSKVPPEFQMKVVGITMIFFIGVMVALIITEWSK